MDESDNCPGTTSHVIQPKVPESLREVVGLRLSKITLPEKTWDLNEFGSKRKMSLGLPCLAV